MSHQRTVYLIDEDLETRRSLTLHLASTGAEAWPFGSAPEFLEILPHLMPGCILVDIDGPGGLSLLAALVERESGWPVLAMSAGADVATAVKAMKLGAADLLEKPIDGPRLAAALIPAWASLSHSIERSAARRAAQERLARLTPRELDISLALFAGRSNKTVAHDLGISVRTVEMHRAHVMAKLAVRSIAEAAVLATHAGLTPSPGAAGDAAAPTARVVEFPASRRLTPGAWPLRSAV